MRWWLLKHVAAWCGLKVGITARRCVTDPLPSFVGLTADDQTTLEAMQVMAHMFGTRPALTDDPRLHTEWTH